MKSILKSELSPAERMGIDSSPSLAGVLEDKFVTVIKLSSKVCLNSKGS